MENNEGRTQADLIREVFMYAHRYRGKCFVIQIESGLVEDVRLASLIRDVSFLHKNGIQLILVPGAAQRIDEVLASYNVQTRTVDGIRISDEEAIQLIKMAAFDVANRVMTELATQQVDAVIGNWVRARSIGVREGVDFQQAGTVAGVNESLLYKVMEDGLVPILPCIGWSSTGTPHNISSIELASHLAETIQADKLFFITHGIEFSEANFTVPGEGIVSRDGVLTRMSAQVAEKFVNLNAGNPHTQELRLLGVSAKAVQAGVDRVHILDGRHDGVMLMEIFSTLGQGTMVHLDPFDSIRPMRISDVPEVLHIMEPNMAKGLLVRRDEEQLRRSYEDYVVFETDGTVRGCAALHKYEGNRAELAGLAVDASYAYLGIGQRLVTFLLDKARATKLDAVFLLTTQTGDFFELLGFRKGNLDDLPETKRKNYNKSRASRIYTYQIPH